MKYNLLIIGFSSMVLVGCVNQPSSIYYWGEYEQLIYNMYNKPGEAPPSLQIEQLNTDIQKAQEDGKPVHPGLYAHLGFMYAIEGKIDASMQAFAKEKELFPESATLVDGLITRTKNFVGINQPVVVKGEVK